ncbi:aldo/keto reductase [Pseudaestuariivita rosea]|uniref:aldo/keto reductase n=1 Tax=Pseudaestuariivita rosea TaxID=2763263 RepID=UPI001ABAA902|nr:aldo/keto reductase [Pseudaestuariivita rosea]
MTTEHEKPEAKSHGTTRRGFLRSAASIGAIAATGPTAYAQVADTPSDTVADQVNPATDVITREIAATGQRIPALGLGTFLTFDTVPGQPREPLREVMTRFVEGSGTVIDTSPLYGSAETTIGTIMAGLPQADEVFVANKIWSTGEYLGDTSHATASLEQSKLRIWRSSMDLMQCHSITNAGVVIPLMQAWKQEGEIGLVGVTHHETAYQPELTQFIERGAVDIVQTNYSIFNRSAEERLLPAAADNGVSILVNLPLEKARLTHIVRGQPLPDFATEFRAETWSQFFLKWVMGHPAVTCVLCGTSNPDHMTENLGAMRGPLPDAEMRRRMVSYMDGLPGFATLGNMAWYPEKDSQYQGQIRLAQAQARDRLAN